MYGYFLESPNVNRKTSNVYLIVFLLTYFIGIVHVCVCQLAEAHVYYLNQKLLFQFMEMGDSRKYPHNTTGGILDLGGFLD